jgi:hypothetical protein
MAKPTLRPDQFVAEMNRRIASYDGYTAGSVFLVPQGSPPDKATGIDVDGPIDMRAFAARAYAEVLAEFDLGPRRLATGF